MIVFSKKDISNNTQTKLFLRGNEVNDTANGSFSHPYASIFAGGIQGFLSTPWHSNFDIQYASTLWHLEFWVNYTQVGTVFEIGAQTGYSGYGSVQFYINSSNYFIMQASSTGTGYNINNTSTITLNSSGWNHVRAINNGTNVLFYINNSSAGSFSSVNLTALNSSGYAELFQAWGNNVGTGHLIGMISDFRFRTGVAADVTTVPSSYVGADNYTRLYLKMDTFGSTFTDSSTAQTAKTITPNSITQHSGKFITNTGTVAVSAMPKHPYATTVGYCPTMASSYSQGMVTGSTDFSVGTGDMTIEYWGCMMSNPSPGNQSLYVDVINSDSSDGFAVYYNNNGGTLQMRAKISSVSQDRNCTLSLGTWYHIAAVRSSGYVTIYVNGTALDSAVSQPASITTTSAQPVLWQYQAASCGSWYFADIRISKVARYTSNFSVPTTYLTSDANTLLLVKGDKVGTTFYDSSSYARTCSVTNSTYIFQNYLPFAKALSFNGSSQYLYAANSSDFNLGTNDFTTDFWFKNNTPSTSYKYLFNFGSSGGNGISCMIDNGTSNVINFALSSNGSSNDILAGTVTTGTYISYTWNHVALVRSGTNFYVFVNGTQTYTFTSSSAIYFPSTLFYVGVAYTSAFYGYFPGYISNLRFTKGLARWTKNFIPPTRY